MTLRDSTGTETPLLRTLSGLILCITSPGYSSVSFIISFDKLVNLSVSLSSVSPSSKYSNPREKRLQEPPVCGPVGQKLLINPRLPIATEVRNNLVGLSP